MQYFWYCPVWSLNLWSINNEGILSTLLAHIYAERCNTHRGRVISKTWTRGLHSYHSGDVGWMTETGHDVSSRPFEEYRHASDTLWPPLIQGWFWAIMHKWPLSYSRLHFICPHWSKTFSNLLMKALTGFNTYYISNAPLVLVGVSKPLILKYLSCIVFFKYLKTPACKEAILNKFGNDTWRGCDAGSGIYICKIKIYDWESWIKNY